MGQGDKNPGTAAVLSFVFNGLGQLYNGQIIKGLVIIFFSSLSLLVFIVAAALIAFWIIERPIFPAQLFWGAILAVLSLVFMCVLGIYSIVDAHKVARDAFKYPG